MTRQHAKQRVHRVRQQLLFDVTKNQRSTRATVISHFHEQCGRCVVPTLASGYN
jgi:hypothetical protein